MRIGILTLPMGNNYGGILQAYALQQTLVGMGHEVFLLDRGWPEHWSAYETLSYIVYKTLSLFGRERITKQECERRTGPEMKRFVETHFPNRVWVNASAKDLGASTIKSLSLDAIVVGSDQIWRREYARRIGFCFLDFARTWGIKKVAYAASFGKDDWTYSPAETRQCAELLKEFDAVSVREKSAAELCQKHFGVKAEVMPDPTLLWTPSIPLEGEGSQESKVESLKSEVGKREVISYFLAWTIENRAVADAVAKELQMEHRPLCKGIYFGTDPQKVTPLGSVESWLESFQTAAAVVTDSFHGTVFAILNHRPFVTLANKSGGISRIHTLLEHYGLEQHLVSSADEAAKVVGSPVDWHKVDEILLEDRKRAHKFLSNSLKLPETL